WPKFAVLAAVLVGLTALWRFTPLAHVVTADNVIGWRPHCGASWWGPLVLMAAYTPACFVMFPRPLLTLAGVVAFGPLLRFLYALVGIVGSATVTYFVGRRVRRDTVRRLAGPKLDRIVAVLKRDRPVRVDVVHPVPHRPCS